MDWAKVEMKHVDALLDRILFLGGMPIVSKLNAIQIGPNVKDQFENDLAAEMEAVEDYNEAIHEADSENDATTQNLLEDNVKDENDHINYIEAQLSQIEQMSLENYLSIISD